MVEELKLATRHLAPDRNGVHFRQTHTRPDHPLPEQLSTPIDANDHETAPFIPSPPGWAGLPIPERLGGYRLVAELGKGGMGVVFRGEDVRLGRAVAIKLILPEYANQPKTRARFLREAKSQANVASDHVVPIHHIGEEGEVPYIVMPLLNGETLEGRLKREPIPPLSTTLQVGLEVAMGLAAAHDRRLIHRDIKPSNIWLEANAAGAFHRCKILDFGLARPVDPAGTPITVHRAILGTPAYMSPEQAGEAPIDHRTDLYSLGVVLYEMATGVQPFHSTNIVQTLIRVATARPGPAIDLNPKLPRELSDLIGRMMCHNVGERPQSAAEVVDELRGIAARCPR